jgi:large subunit ribosomal protein L9
LLNDEGDGMQVILLEKIRNLGNLGDKVSVKPGFGRNCLIPQGKAIFATEENLEKFEIRRKELEKSALEKLEAAKARADALAQLATLIVNAKAGEEGKLFGSVGAREIANALTESGFKAVKSEIIMPQGLIRQIGEYEVFIQLHSDIRVTVKVNVVAGE